MEINIIKKANTNYIGKNIIYYEEIDSTHIQAKKLSKQHAKNGSIIIAEHQNAGIGTKGRAWHTGDENIAMSILLYPNCKIGQLEGLTVKIAEIIKETIWQLYQITLEIKKPNDLLLNGKKISGILTR